VPGRLGDRVRVVLAEVESRRHVEVGDEVGLPGSTPSSTIATVTADEPVVTSHASAASISASGLPGFPAIDWPVLFSAYC
jgi:hypothetical protein